MDCRPAHTEAVAGGKETEHPRSDPNGRSEVKHMSPRIGRPKIENPKSIDLKVRIDERTNQALLLYCKKNAMTRAEALRKGLSLLLAQ